MKIEKKLDKILTYFELKGHDNLKYDSQNVVWNGLAKEVAGNNNKFFLLNFSIKKYCETNSKNYNMINIT